MYCRFQKGVFIKAKFLQHGRETEVFFCILYIRNLVRFTGLKTNLINLKSLTKNCEEKLKRGYMYKKKTYHKSFLNFLCQQPFERRVTFFSLI